MELIKRMNQYLKKTSKETAYKWAMTIFTIIWFVFMLFLSHENGDESGKITGNIAEKIGQATIETENMPWYEKEAAFNNINLTIRSLAHVVVFCVFSILVVLTVRAWKKRQLYAIFFLAFWSVGDEFLKYFTDGRHCDFVDILKNLIGVLIGNGIIFILIFIKNKIKRRGISNGTN